MHIFSFRNKSRKIIFSIRIIMHLWGDLIMSDIEFQRFARITLLVVYCAPMASKDTPKKHYKKIPVSTQNSRCRLCKSVVDPYHSKNLFRNTNQSVLRNAETVYGGALPQVDGLPHLICRPCERRLNNAIQFKNTIRETQRSLLENLRSKRCIEVSPSIVKPPAKIQTVVSRRRSLDFSTPADDVPVPVSKFIVSCSYLVQATLLHILRH